MSGKTHDHETFTVKDNYHGYKITYSEHNKRFYAMPIDKERNLPSLEDTDSFNLKYRIRQAVSKARATKFKIIKAISPEFRPMHITSIAKKRKDWHTDKTVYDVRASYRDEGDERFDTRRTKLQIPNKERPIYEDSPENMEKIEQIKKLKAEIETIRKSLAVLDPEVVIRQYIEV